MIVPHEVDIPGQDVLYNYIIIFAHDVGVLDMFFVYKYLLKKVLYTCMWQLKDI